MATSSVVLALCTHFRVITIAIIYIVVLISASVSAFEFPTRQAIIPTLVPRSQLANAFTLSSAMMQLTFVIGAAFGGYTVAWLGVVNTYWLDVFSYLAVIGSILLMIVPRIPVEKRAQSSISALIDGIHFLRSHPIILAVLSLDFFATFFGSPRALLPIYASDILHVGPQGLGILLAATSIGAVAFTPFTGWISRIVRRGLGVALAIIVWGGYCCLWPGPRTALALSTPSRWCWCRRYGEHDLAWTDNSAHQQHVRNLCSVFPPEATPQ